jgi:hypothetical protein
MRYLKSFSESFDEILTDLTDGNFDSWIRIEDNVKDIFVEYQDSNDLDVVVGRGFLPMTIGVDFQLRRQKVIEVKLFAQRGIRFNEISGEIGMLIEYMKSLTDKEVKIYYDIDRSGLRNWRPLAGSDNEFDYYLQGKSSMSFNTIRIYFVESVDKKLNESSQEDSKIVDDIDDIFVEMWDSGLTHLVSKDGIFINISILKKRKDTIIDFDLLKDCVEMTKDYLSELGNFKEFYRFGYVSERVTAKMTNNGPVYTKKSSRDNIEYSSFPYSFTDDVQNKHALEHRFDYEIEGIKIRFKQK